MTIAVERGTPDQAPGQAQTDPAQRQRLIAGRFRLIDQLGRGGMGRVFRAHDEVLDRTVAVKLIYDDAVPDRDVQHACALEARAAARLNHPGIVRILDSGFDDGHCYVVMSLVEGRPLNEVLREDGPLPVDRAIDLAIQIADALAAAHREGVIHCDVKPGNLLVDANWRIRLVDFGIARVTSSTTGLTGEMLQGSAQYVAPEQVEGASVDGRTDLYALGTVLYEMLAGKTPFGGGTIASILARRLVNDPPSVREVNPDVPPQVDQVILRALARDPEARTQTAAELRDALMAIRQDMLTSAAPERRPGERSIVPPPPRGATADPVRPWLTWDRSRQVFTAGTAKAKVWSATSARLAREVGGTVLPDAMTRAQLLTPARRPTLRSGVGLAVLLGLLVGATAAKCGVAGVSAEAALAPESAVVAVATSVAPTPTLVLAPVEVAPLAESAPQVATEPPPPTPVPPTATAPEPALAEAEPEPTAVPPLPAVPAPRPPVRALAVPPPAPVAPEPAPAENRDQDANDDDKKPSLSNTPRDDEKTPEERAKLDAKQNEAEKRNDPPRPARASTLVPAVSKPEPPKPEPPRQQAAPKPQAPPIQVQNTVKPEPPKPVAKPTGNDDKPGNGNGNGNGNKKR